MKATLPEERPARRGQTKKSTLIIACLGILFLTFALFTRALWIASTPKFWGTSTPKSQNSTAENNIAELHPDQHVFRDSTTLEYTWQIASCEQRPDGVLKRVYCINNQFPGPTIEARSGDRLIVKVSNAMEEGLAFHWHGLLMKGANHMDGAVGITQSPINPGETFEYSFTIDEEQSGTFWYHAHEAVQRADGLFGGLVVHKPIGENDRSAELDAEYLFMVSDWYHRSAQEALEFYMHPGAFGNEPVPDSLLVNGVGFFHCADAPPARPVDCRSRISGIPNLKLDQRKRNIIRLANTGSYAGIRLAINGAKLTPIKVDGGNAVVSGSAKSVGILYPGERVDLLVEPSTTFQDQALEISLDDTSFKYPNSALTLTHRFAFSWTNVDENIELKKGVLEKVDLQSLSPLNSRIASLEDRADETMVLYAITQKLAHLDNVPRGFINHTSWEPPEVPLTASGRHLWDKNQFVPHIQRAPTQTTWVEIVLNNLDEEGHPFHLHGHQFYVLSTYSSSYNWGSYNPFEDAEPSGGQWDSSAAIKKDTVYVPRRGYAVIRVPFDHSGIWMFHCHVQWHQASGMSMAFEVD